MSAIIRKAPSWMQQWWLWFTALFALTLAIFWSKFIAGMNDYNLPVVVHGISALGWMLLTIVQAILIKNRRRKIHRTIGYFSLIIAVVVVISGLQMERQGIQRDGTDAIGEPLLAIKFFYNDVTGLALFSLFLGLAVIAARRKDIALHLRLIACTAIIPIMPALIRLFPRIMPQMVPDFTTALITSQVALLSLAVLLVSAELRYSRLRWPFVSLVIYYMFMLMTTEIIASKQWLQQLAIGFSEGI
jgi:hypothetical protein